MHATLAKQKRSRAAKSLLNTIPIVLVGSMAIGLGLTGTVESASATKRMDKPKVSPTDLGKVVKEALAHAGSHITSHVVAPAPSAPLGAEHVSGDRRRHRELIAGRFGLATASVLALNGLAWKSIIFPGQVLKLTAGGPSAAPVARAPQATPPSTSPGRYTIVRGDTISAIAARFHVSTASVLQRQRPQRHQHHLPGQTVGHPGQPAAAPRPRRRRFRQPLPSSARSSPRRRPAPTGTRSWPGDTISSIAGKFGVSIQSILSANGLNWSSIIYTGQNAADPEWRSSCRPAARRRWRSPPRWRRTPGPSSRWASPSA